MADTKISGLATTVMKKDLTAQDYAAISRAGDTNAKVDLSEFLNTDRVDLRDFPDFDPSGQTSMLTSINAWQVQARDAGRIAYAPPGIFGLGGKAIFRAPTVCAGAGLFKAGGQPSTPTDGLVPYTCFKNLGINDNSWMIDVESSSGESAGGNFGVLKGFRVHAGGLNCSLLRVLGVESVADGGINHYAFEKFLWDDVLGYGGWVNFEHYGYGGLIRGVYSRAARLSAFRAYLCNALTVQGGWFGVAGEDAWEFEVFCRGGSAYLGENSHGIIFNQPVFQSQDTAGVRGSNGLRISERVREVTLNAYFEGHVQTIAGQDGATISGLGGVALQVGWNRGEHPSGLIPTAVDITGEDAPTNDSRYSATNINLSGCTGGAVANNLRDGARYMFNNVRGITWGRCGVNTRRVEYTKYARDIDGYATPMASSAVSLSSMGGRNPTAITEAGEDVIYVDSTVNFTAGDVVYISLESISGREASYETTVVSVVTNTSVTVADPVPVGRRVTTGQIICRNKLDRAFVGVAVQDELQRGGGPLVNLLPAGNFLGTTADAAIGGFIHGVKEAFTNFSSGGRATIETDTTIRRNGRPTLKVTRKGTVVPGASTCRFWLYPWGNEDFCHPGMVVVVSGWYLMEDVAPFNSTDFSDASTWDSPNIGLTWDTPTGENHAAVSAAFTGADNGSWPVCGHWYPFLYRYVLNDPVINKIGINFLPSNGNGYNWTTDGSVWFDSLGIFVNPRSEKAIFDGEYTHNPAAGHFDVGGVFECTADAVPTGDNVRIFKGDTFKNTSPDAGGFDRWRCVTTGSGATAVVKQAGVIEA